MKAEIKSEQIIETVLDAVRDAIGTHKDITPDHITTIANVLIRHNVLKPAKEQPDLTLAYLAGVHEVGSKLGVLQEAYKQLEIRNDSLVGIIREIWWMAKRYADGRSTYAPHTVNRCVDLLLKMGIQLSPDLDTLYAEDGNFGKWCSTHQEFDNCAGSPDEANKKVR